MSTSHFRLPYGYSGAPPWPSLYWPFGPGFEPVNLIADVPHSLYYLQGIWAFLMFAKARTLRWYTLIMIPIIFVVAGSLASFVIGSIIGVALAFVYNAGFFVMSTWIPFLWALIQILVVMVGSYSTITTIL
ncbi:hypothetical protein BDB00DRAFT_882089 [Zychaea mexicana]|uniref:uncharacterized protein n=1 Tax=Zychaea mexicana TaxID=64656 RepID=UPI0022FE6DE7|nr:uncharacterized protein BDB00DRAFT_882089 [Zychaea mexicana]KAI9496242.1 hypothetical protein BDB00DRAFT_882089 [Zychaea mexicana]